MRAFFSGFFLGLSLIAVIGAQNTFVLRQGLLRQHVLAVCLICALSDALLIIAGVAGFGGLVTVMPWIKTVLLLAGVVFLSVYGIRSFIAAFTNRQALKPSEMKAVRLSRTMAVCLAFTWLNPHVYLDTIVLIGSVLTNYGDNRFIFGAGAIVASFVFFLFLGFGARFMAPLFTRSASWRVLEFFIGCVMLALVVKLLFDILGS